MVFTIVIIGINIFLNKLFIQFNFQLTNDPYLSKYRLIVNVDIIMYKLYVRLYYKVIRKRHNDIESGWIREFDKDVNT